MIATALALLPGLAILGCSGHDSRAGNDAGASGGAASGGRAGGGGGTHATIGGASGSGSGGATTGGAWGSGGGGIATGGASGSGNGGATTGGASGSGGGTTGGASGSGGGATGGASGNSSGGAAMGGGPSGAGGRGGMGAGGTAGLAGGAGGTGGTGGSGLGGAGGLAGPCAAPGLILCETFEEVSPQQLPTAVPWLATSFGCNDATSGGTGVLEVQEGDSHGGARALVSQSANNQCVLRADLNVNPELWVRAWVKIKGTGPDQFKLVNEATFFGFGSRADDDPRVTVGYAGTSMAIVGPPCTPPGLEVNVTGSSARTGCSTTAIQTDHWYCFELHMTQSIDNASSVTAELFVDRQQLMFAPQTDVTATTVSNTRPFPFRYLVLGVRSYQSNYSAPATYDDIAVGTQRIGCD